MSDFMPPTSVVPIPDLFTSTARSVVQSAEQSHEYKKSSGSSDGAHTYDTNKR